VLDLPLRMPLPSKITINVLPRIDLREELGADADADDVYELVTSRMQSKLSGLAEDRAIPVVG
jgi:hypothetical protein